MTKTLKNLLSKQSAWLCDQTKTFLNIKEELSSNRILAWYNPNAEIKVSADASAYGLGAVLLQKHESQ